MSARSYGLYFIYRHRCRGETHWTDQGEFTHNNGYKIICSGNDTLPTRGGVALILNKTAQKALLGYNTISQRLLTARFKTKSGGLTVIQVYAPNSADKEEQVDDFYQQLQIAINNVHNKDILMIIGDLNAKVGSDHDQWNQVIGQYGFGVSNMRGEKLLHFCAANDLFITNTMFKQPKDSRQWTWESPDEKTHNKIDYIMISNKWKYSINNSRSFPSADTGSDHQLVLANLRLRFKRKQKTNYPKKYDVSKLKDTANINKYEVEIGGRFAPLLEEKDTDVEGLWDNIKSAFSETSKTILGYRKSSKQDPWISNEVLQLSKDRKKIKQEKLHDASKRPRYNFLTREIRRKTKRM